MRPPFALLWREAHATSAVAAGVAASFPASIAMAIVFVLRDSIYGAPLTFTAGRLVIQLAIGAAWGAIFGAAVAFTAHHLPSAAGAFWGALYGLAVWLVWFVLFLPLVKPDLAGHTRLGLVGHLVFGAILGSTFHLARVSERRRHRSTGGHRPKAATTDGSHGGIAPPPR